MAGSGRKKSAEDLKNINMLTVRNQTKQEVTNVIFPNGLTVGLDDNRFNAGFKVHGDAQVNGIVNSQGFRVNGQPLTMDPVFAPFLFLDVDSYATAFDDNSDSSATPSSIGITITQSGQSSTIGSSNVSAEDASSSTLSIGSFSTTETSTGNSVSTATLDVSSLGNSSFPVTVTVTNEGLTSSKTILSVVGGDDGTSPSTPRTVNLTSTSTIISYDENGLNPSPASITFTATSNNPTGQYKFTGGGSDFTDETSYGGESSDTDTASFTSPNSYHPDPLTFRVDVSDDGSTSHAFDHETIVSVKPGLAGSSATDTILFYGDPASIQVQADSSGAVTSLTSHDFMAVYARRGTTDVVYNGDNDGATPSSEDEFCHDIDGYHEITANAITLGGNVVSLGSSYSTGVITLQDSGVTVAQITVSDAGDYAKWLLTNFATAGSTYSSDPIARIDMVVQVVANVGSSRVTDTVSLSFSKIFAGTSGSSSQSTQTFSLTFDVTDIDSNTGAGYLPGGATQSDADNCKVSPSMFSLTSLSRGMIVSSTTFQTLCSENQAETDAFDTTVGSLTNLGPPCIWVPAANIAISNIVGQLTFTSDIGSSKTGYPDIMGLSVYGSNDVFSGSPSKWAVEQQLLIDGNTTVACGNGGRSSDPHAITLGSGINISRDQMFTIIPVFQFNESGGTITSGAFTLDLTVYYT